MSVTFTFGWTMDDGVTCAGLVCEHTCPVACPDSIIYHGYCEHVHEAKAECVCSKFDVNVSNTNFEHIAVRLGINPEAWGGEMEPEEFLGRTYVANVGRFDSGFESQEYATAGMKLIECGLRPGYFEDRMAALADLAIEAKRLGYVVAWG